MKTNNNKGSVFLPIMILSAVVATMAGAFIMWCQCHRRVQVHNIAKDDAAILTTSMKMILSHPEACVASLKKGAFGTSLQELDDLSASHNIKVLNPSTGTMLLEPGKSMDRLRVVGAEFDNAADRIKVSNSENTYIANLTVRFADAFGHQLKSAVIPFYILTDAGGNLTGCFATTYVDPTAVPLVTMENFLCERASSANLVYSPIEHTCVANSTMISGN